MGDDVITEWINSMKIALLESNVQKAFWLTQHLPFCESSVTHEELDSLHIIKELIKQAIELMEQEQEATRLQMQKIKKMKGFLF